MATCLNPFDCTCHARGAKFSRPDGDVRGRMEGLKAFEKREEDMNRRSLLTTSVPTMLAAALLPSSVGAQEISLKELVGSWIFVSAQDVKPDGSKVDPWGPNPKGAAMFDDQWSVYLHDHALRSSEVCIQEPSASNCRRR